MRIWILAFPPLLMLIIFSMIGCGIRWDEPGSQTVDQMLTNGSRSHETGFDGTESMNTASLGSGSSMAFNSEKEGSIPVPGQQTQPAQGTNSAAISGRWAMELNFGSPPKASLTLFQDGDAVYGTGALSIDSKTSLVVAASGTVAENSLNLDIVSIGKVHLYRISMTVIGNSASGSYTAFRPSETPTSGIITGLRSVE